MFAEAIQSILASQCTPAFVRSVEGGADPQPLVSALSDAGFLDLLVPEEQGGGGAGWRDFFDVVALCGAYAVPVPLAQTLAARALVANAAQLPAGLISFAPALTRMPDGALVARDVPGGRHATHLLAVDDDRLVLLDCAAAHRLPTGIRASLDASFRWPREAAPHAGQPLAPAIAPQTLQRFGALLHAGLLAGALKRTFDLTLGYANDRVQFGKSIGKFQAIQQQLSVAAEHCAAARMAAQAAFASGDTPSLAACAAAKGRTSEAAQLVASIAHAVHGAIGVTEEYDLQLYTRRLHAWRMAHGSEAYWYRVLGAEVMASQPTLSADFARSVF